MTKLDPTLQQLVIDGVEYHWRMRHLWVLQYSTPVKGISISVWLQTERTRELILDLPYSLFNPLRPASKPALVNAVRHAIPAAIADGWDPESRGRAYRFEVPEVGGNAESESPA